MTIAIAAAGAVLVALIEVACATMAWRSRGMKAGLRSATACQEVAAGLIGGDAQDAVEASLTAACNLLGAGTAVLVIAAGDGDHGMRARHGGNGGAADPLGGADLDDTELGALDALESSAGHAAVVVGLTDQDSRLVRFAATAGLGATVAVPLTTDAPVRGMLAFGDVRGSLNTVRRDAALIATYFSSSLGPGALLRRALDTSIASRHAATAQTLQDPLTSLPTRAIFLEALHQALEHRESGRPIALVMIRLGGLMSAMERLGPAAGGAVLGEVGSRLSGLMRHSDVAARVGESEFALLLSDLRDAAEAATVTQRVHEGLARQVVVGDVALDTCASIGVRIVEGDEAIAMALMMRDAAAALSAAQESDGGYRVFDNSLAGEDSAELIDELRDAIHDDALTLHYQPIIDLRDGTVLGAEALVRWFHPTRGSVAPMSFLPLAEEAGVGTELGLWVLRHAAAQLRAWQTAFPRTPPLAMSVNISAAHLADSRFSRDVLEVLHEAEIDPESVILEFAEDVLQARLETVQRIIDPLQRTGIQIAVDDVGTGHAALEYLRHMPVDILKIGRPFIAALVDGDPSTSTAHAIVTRGGLLKMSLVAEGVETALQVSRLRDLGCTMAQGFHLSRPLDINGMNELLAVGHVELEDVPAATSAAGV